VLVAARWLVDLIAYKQFTEFDSRVFEHALASSLRSIDVHVLSVERMRSRCSKALNQFRNLTQRAV
jgi:hypothetical protein